MKPVFKLEDYPGKYVMHCPEKQQAEKFCKFLHDAGKEWPSGSSYADESNWRFTEEETCYNFNEDVYGEAKLYRRDCYTVLEFDDFEWPGCAAGATDNNVTTTHTLTEVLINERFSRLLSDCPCAETPAEAARELEAVFTAWAGALDEFREVNKNA